MPTVLERCVKTLIGEGYSSARAWAVCSKKTGWKKAPGGGWRKRENGKWKYYNHKEKSK